MYNHSNGLEKFRDRLEFERDLFQENDLNGNNEGSDVDADLIATTESEKKTKRKTIGIKTKLDIVKMAQSTSIYSAAKFFKIYRSCVRRYIKQGNELEKLYGKRKRIDGAGRRLTSAEIDAALALWIHERRAEKKRVTRRIIRNEAANRFADAEIPFKRSHGWMESFLKRHSLSLRAPTTTCQKLPSEFEKILVDYILKLNAKIDEKIYKHIFACDETAVWPDASTSKCIESIGAKEIGVLNRGYDKMNISVMLTGRSDGKKLRTFVVMLRKTLDKKIESKLLLCCKGKKNKCFDNGITKEFLERTFKRLGFFNKNERPLLIWDQHVAYKSDSTKEHLEKLNLDCAYVPGGTTKYVQPADVSWNAPFKAKIRQQYEDWILTSAPDLTRSRKDGIGGGNQSLLQWAFT